MNKADNKPRLNPRTLRDIVEMKVAGMKDEPTPLNSFGEPLIKIEGSHEINVLQRTHVFLNRVVLSMPTRITDAQMNGTRSDIDIKLMVMDNFIHEMTDAMWGDIRDELVKMEQCLTYGNYQGVADSITRLKEWFIP